MKLFKRHTSETTLPTVENRTSLTTQLEETIAEITNLNHEIDELLQLLLSGEMSQAMYEFNICFIDQQIDFLDRHRKRLIDQIEHVVIGLAKAAAYGEH